MTSLVALFLVISSSFFIANVLSCGTYMDNSTVLFFYADSFDLRTAPTNPTYSPQLSFQGLNLQINPNGQLQVLDGSEVVWGWGATDKDCTYGQSSCHLVFQSDGNLVLYYADGSAVGTNTYNQNAQYVVFSVEPPYIIVTDGNCNQLWPTSSEGPDIGPLPRNSAEWGPTTTISGNNVQAIPAATWKKSFGLNTHMSQGWSSSMVLNMSVYLGCGTIRDGVPYSNQIADCVSMQKVGITLNVVTGGANDINGLKTEVQNYLNFMQSVPGMLTQIEGFNEINNQPFTYNGIDPSTTYVGMAQAMKDLYGIVRGIDQLDGIPVIDMTGQLFNDGVSLGLYNFTGRADYGNVHSYPYGGQQTVCTDDTKDMFSLSLGQNYYYWQQSGDYYLTEGGYHTDTFAQGVTELAAGKMLVNMLLNGIYFGMRQTFIYEMFDEVWSGYDGPESHFGLFRNDGSAKPAAAALHRLGLLLSNQGDDVSGQLSYTFDNVPIGARSLLFQSTNGTFFLVVWNTAPVYNPITQSDIVTDPIQVTLTLPTSTTFRVYDIYSDTNQEEVFTLKVTDGPSVTFPFSDQAVVIAFD